MVIAIRTARANAAPYGNNLLAKGAVACGLAFADGLLRCFFFAVFFCFDYTVANIPV